MRIDTSIPIYSKYILCADVPYRYAYRHIHIAAKRSNISLLERVTHITMAGVLSVPVLGMVVAIAEKILFHKKNIETKKPVVSPNNRPTVILPKNDSKPEKSELNSDPQSNMEPVKPEQIIDPVLTKVPVQVNQSSTLPMAEQKPKNHPQDAVKEETKDVPEKTIEKKPIDPKLWMDLIDNKVAIDTLTLEEIEQLADNGKFWSLLESSKKQVALIFDAKHYQAILENGHIATIDDRNQTVTALIDLIPESKIVDVELMKTICKHATPEMEFVLNIKFNRMRRHPEAKKSVIELKKIMSESFTRVRSLRANTNIPKLHEKKPPEKKFKFNVPLPSDAVHQKPVNGGNVGEDLVLIPSEELSNKLEANKENVDILKDEAFLLSLLNAYGTVNEEQQKKSESLFKLAFNSQLATQDVLSKTLKMMPVHISSFVKIIEVVNPQKISVLWDQLLKNKAAFLGDQGKTANSLRAGAVFKALTEKFLQHSLECPKFHIILKDYPKEAAMNLSSTNLNLVSDASGPEVLSELIPSLDESEGDQLYDTLVVVCTKFPKLMQTHKIQLNELDKSLAEMDSQKNNKTVNMKVYSDVKSRFEDVKSQMITLERVLRVKIKKITDPIKSSNLLKLAGF